MVPRLPLLYKECKNLHGRVTALFKSGDRCNTSNYRPMTILPTISKILEKAAHFQLCSYILQENILKPKQFPFKIMRWLTLLFQITWIRAISLELFFQICPKRLIPSVMSNSHVNKLDHLGFSYATIDWFRSYL